MGRLEGLEQQQEALTAENQLLQEQVKQNSQNSSQPPSQDIGKGFKPKPKGAGSRKPGGNRVRKDTSDGCIRLRNATVSRISGASAASGSLVAQK